jgi:hypothetical protein
VAAALSNTIILAFFIFLNIVLAKFDASRIERGKRIKHGINGLIYAVVTLAAFFISKSIFLIPVILFTRLIVFNIALSEFRGFKWYYISTERKSVIDNFVYKIFGSNGRLMYQTYITLLIVLLIFLYGL